jgi:hypothetical protein
MRSTASRENDSKDLQAFFSLIARSCNPTLKSQARVQHFSRHKMHVQA